MEGDEKAEILVQWRDETLILVKRLGGPRTCLTCEEPAVVSFTGPTNDVFIFCDKHAYQHGIYNNYIDPFSDIDKYCRQLIDALLYDPRPLSPALCYRSGKALAPILESHLHHPHNSGLGERKHHRAASSLVLFVQLTGVVARHTVLFVVKCLPNCVKDIRVMIGKLLWSRYKSAWARHVAVPTRNFWK